MAGNSTSNPLFNYRQAANYAKGALIVVPFGYKSGKNVFKGPIPFVLNPETISESLTGGWIHKTVPGQNDPVSSWVGNGVRSLSLALLINNDNSSFGNSQFSSQQTSAGNPYGQSVLGAIGAAAAKIPLPIFKNLAPQEPGVLDPTLLVPQDISITAQLDQIRQLRYGELYKNGLYSTPPSLVKFQFDGKEVPGGNHVSNPTLGNSSNLLGDVYWTVDSIEINVTKWSSNLQPLEAEVKMTLTQFNDINRSKALVAGNGNQGGQTGANPFGFGQS
jgi:hypothetical protein